MSDDLYFTDPNELRRYKIKTLTGNILKYLFLTIVGIFIIIPFYWMINTSLKDGGSLATSNGLSDAISKQFFPSPIRFANYAEVFQVSTNFVRYFLNTLLVSVVTTCFVIVTTILAAFAFSRLQFKGRDLLFTILLSTMMVPGEMLVTSNYMIVSTYGLTNTYWALILPFAVSTFYIFFLRQTFRQIPNELYLAAKVDGKNDFTYLLKVMIPIAKPAIITIAILSSMGAWNSYIWPNLVASKDEMKLVTNGLMSVFTSQFGSAPQGQVAASFLVTLPLLLMFILFRKQIMRGVSRSGIKG